MSACRWLRLLRSGAAAAAALALGACASTVGLSDLALDYNEAASRSNDQLLLLNILRASHRAPYQFTALTSVNGANQLSASLNLGVAPSGRSGILMLGGQQTSTLTDNFLDTREFYNGMSTSVPGTIVNNFFHDSPSDAILASLFFDRITIGTPSRPGCHRNPHMVDCERTFHNAPRNARDFALFQYVLQQMLVAGLSTEAVRLRKKDDDKAYRADNEVMVPDEVRFCFRTTLSNTSAIAAKDAAQCEPLDTPPLKARPDGRASRIAVKLTPGFAKQIGLILGQRLIDDREEDRDSDDEHIQRSVAALSNAPSVDVELHVRSTLHIIEFLGDVASAELYKGYTPLVRLSESDEGRVAGDAGRSCVVDTGGCAPLFVVRRGAAPGDIAVRYHGDVFSVPDDADGHASNAVLAVVRQLIALSTSSKAFPAPSVLTLVP